MPTPIDSKTTSGAPGQTPPAPAAQAQNDAPQLAAVPLRCKTLADILKQTNFAYAMDMSVSTNVSTNERIGACLKIAEQLQDLHSRSITHGQLDSTRIQMSENLDDIKLLCRDLPRNVEPGLGSTNKSAEEEKAKLTAEENAKASAGYWAPERFQDPQAITTATDVYAFGCILFVALMQQEPFAGHGFEVIKAAVLAGTRPAFDRVRTGPLPLEILRLTSDCMAADSKDRPTMECCVERLKNTLLPKKAIGTTPSTTRWSPGLLSNGARGEAPANPDDEAAAPRVSVLIPHYK